MSDDEDSPEPFPEDIARLLWDRVPGSVRWVEHRDFVIERVLVEGTWNDTLWLRRHVDDDELRAWLRRTRARKLEARAARFWQFVLDIPEAELREWLADPARQVWDRRCAPEMRREE